MKRRDLLKGLGALASLPLLRPVVASAASDPHPLRFVGIYFPHGANSPLYAMRPGETETQFDLTYADCVLQPFDDATTYGRTFKDKVLIVEGIDLSAAIAKSKTGHDAPSSILTGCGGQPTNPSLERYLAVDRALGAMTRVTSVALGVGWAGADLTSSISYGAGGAGLNKLIDPVQTFATLFAGLSPPPMGDPAAQARLEAQWRAGKSTLDWLNADLGRLKARLAPKEQLKLDQHATALRDLEKRLGDLPTPAAPGPTCALPAVPRTFSAVRSYNNGEPNFEEITNLQVDLLAQALACDVTRFATLFLNDLSRGAVAGTGLSGIPSDCHNDLAHRYLPGNAPSVAALGRHNRYSWSKCARLLKRCNELGILDDVGVLMTTDMGDPAAHSSRNVPLVLAGGWGGKFRMGRRLKLAADCPQGQSSCGSPALVSNARVLVSVAQAFGLSDVQSYGTGPDNSGPLPGLT